jgi:hypothetical protein
MRLAASLALLLVACDSGGDDDFPIAPGGGLGPLITPAPDAPQLDASTDGTTLLVGRVCVIPDPRNPTACAVGNAAGLTVTLGARTATTAIDGSFTIAAPSTSNLVWTVTGPGFVPTVMPFSTVLLLPVMTAARYNDLLLDNGVVVQEGQGSLFARVVSGSTPVAGVTAIIEPASVFGPLYDGASALLWDRDATGAGGMVWIPDAIAGPATLTLTGPSITPGALTFGTVAIP